MWMACCNILRMLRLCRLVSRTHRLLHRLQMFLFLTMLLLSHQIHRYHRFLAFSIRHRLALTALSINPNDSRRILGCIMRCRSPSPRSHRYTLVIAMVTRGWRHGLCLRLCMRMCLNLVRRTAHFLRRRHLLHNRVVVSGTGIYGSSMVVSRVCAGGIVQTSIPACWLHGQRCGRVGIWFDKVVSCGPMRCCRWCGLWVRDGGHGIGRRNVGWRQGVGCLRWRDAVCWRRLL